MKHHRWFAQAICLLSLTGFLHAQAPAPDLQAILRNDLMGKQLVLRNFSGSTEVHASWNGKIETTDAQWLHIFAATIVRKLTMKGPDVKIEADQMPVVLDRSGNFALSDVVTHVKYTVTLIGDIDTAAATLRHGLFFPSFEAAFANVPKDFQLPAPQVPGGAVSEASSAECDCADTSSSCDIHRHFQWEAAGVKTPGINPSKLISRATAKYPEEAVQEMVGGRIDFRVLFDETGAITDIWVMRSLGSGIDEAAAIALRQSKFIPATCHDKPVPLVGTISETLKISRQ